MLLRSMSTTIPTSRRDPGRSTRSSASPWAANVAARRFGQPPRAGRGHHHRLLDIDAVAGRKVRRGKASDRGRDRRTHRRHLLHGHRRHPESLPRLPSRRTDRPGERGDPGGRDARRRRSAPQRGDRDGHLARPRPRNRRTAARRRSPTRSCSPTARTSTRRPKQLRDEIGLSEGEFTCDCRGVGTDWHVEELRAISSALLGTRRHRRGPR